MRVVSLVPSVTETLVELGVPPVGCTRFCEQPSIPTVGGTKNPDLPAIERLNPHVVVVNDEENRIEDVEALEALGIRTRSISPRSVEDVGPRVVDVARLVGIESPPSLDAAAWQEWLEQRRREPSGARAFVAVWPRPWMTCSGDTYGSSLLSFLGVENVFADAADRYPEVRIAAVRDRHPDVVLLPTEPYPFAERHVETVAEAFPGVSVALIDGRDLFWWGIRTPRAIRRLGNALDEIGLLSS